MRLFRFRGEAAAAALVLPPPGDVRAVRRPRPLPLLGRRRRDGRQGRRRPPPQGGPPHRRVSECTRSVFMRLTALIVFKSI